MTFHLLLLERKIPDLIRKIELETVAEMWPERTEIIADLEFVEKNLNSVRAYLEPRTKMVFEAFCAWLPEGYYKPVLDNQIMFYHPREHTRATGVGIIIKKKTIWLMALKGLKFREYFANAGFALDSYKLKEF
jgi:hypothetical protein